MSLDGISGSGTTASLRDVAAVPRAGAVDPTQLLRQRVDGFASALTRDAPRPSVDESGAGDSFSDSLSNPAASPQGGAAFGDPTAGGGGAVAPVVAQILAQGQDGADAGTTGGSDSGASTRIAGIVAYEQAARAAGAATGGGGGAAAGLSSAFGGADVILPWASPLASGRTLDLSV